mmetsp:Transcript_37450/g.58194  ORF Transcript_37450/g.58194 Transcript_37450/m.58194 type:complete len:605 (-) Transcript_37450:58-1872(-)
MVAIGIGNSRGHYGTHKAFGEDAEVYEDIEKAYDDSISDHETETSADESEMSDSGIAPLIGMTLTTRFGIGTIEGMHEFELGQYCTIRLKTCGIVTMVCQAVVDVLKRERKLALPQAQAAKCGRLQNLKGYIRMYNPAKGWGFVVCDEFEGDIFLHSKHMVAPAPREYIGHFQANGGGHQVRFDLDLLHRSRPQALNVRVVAVSEQDNIVYPKRRHRSNKTQTTPDSANFEDKLDDSDDTNRDEGQDYMGDEQVIIADADSGDQIGVSNPSDYLRPLADAVSMPSPNLETGTTESEGFQLSLDSHLATLKDLATRKGAVRMRGLPFTARVEDVAEFFKGYGVRPEDVTLGQRADGSASGEALVFFARDELAEKARKEKHMQHLGHRYIELFNAKSANGETPTMSIKGHFVTMPETPDQPTNVDFSSIGIPALGPQANSYAAYAAAFHASQISPQTSAIAPPTMTGQGAEVGNTFPPPQMNSTDHSAWEQDLYQQYFQYFQQTYASVAATQAVQAVQALHATGATKQAATLEQEPPQEVAQQFQLEYPSQPLVADSTKEVNLTASAELGLVEANKMASWQKPGRPNATHVLEYFDGARMHYYNEI